VRRPDLRGPGVRLLNRGGLANPDVLWVPPRSQGGEPCIVKDYATGRAWPLRRLLSRALARRELAQLERVAGLPGVPAWAEAVDERALAMECLVGTALTRHEHYRTLPAEFFTALEGILEGLLARGVVYLDLRSASNVLVTASGAPALVDFASALRLPAPRGLVRWLYARALRKHRRRFECRPGEPIAPSVHARPWTEIDLGRARFRLRDGGRPDDPRPLLLLHDVGLDHRAFGPWFDAAAASGRRAIGVDLPPFGGSRSGRLRARPRERARELLALLDALRIETVEPVGHGWGALVAIALAALAPGRVGRGLLLEAPLGRLDDGFLGRWLDAHLEPRSLRERIRREIPLGLPADARAELERSLALLPLRALASPYRELPLAAAPGPAYALDLRATLPATWSARGRSLLVDGSRIRSWLRESGDR
jgi:pimeloyl-ACP methyl ester carboxylesterase